MKDILSFLLAIAFVLLLATWAEETRLKVIVPEPFEAYHLFYGVPQDVPALLDCMSKVVVIRPDVPIGGFRRNRNVVIAQAVTRCAVSRLLGGI